MLHKMIKKQRRTPRLLIRKIVINFHMVVSQIKTVLKRQYYQKFPQNGPNPRKHIPKAINKRLKYKKGNKEIWQWSLMKAETYLLKIGLAEAHHYKYQYNQTIISKLEMNKSVSSCREARLDRVPTLDLMMEGVDSENWSYTTSGLQLCFSMSGFILVTRSIYCINSDLAFLGYFLWGNGQKFLLPSALREIFFARANKNAQNCHFFTDIDRNQLLLKCSLSLNPNVSAVEKIYECIECIQSNLPAFQQALQSLDLITKHNAFSYKMLKEQLKLKKNIVRDMNSNSVNGNIQWNGPMLEQNSSVVRVKSVTESVNNFSQGPMSKGGYFQVQKKLSVIEKVSGEKEEKELAWKTPVNTNSDVHQNYLQQKAKKQIQFVEKIVDNKFLLNYYISESQPSSIFMDYVPTLLKDKIYRSNLSFSQFLNLAQQLIEAVNVLHLSGLVHRDLKPENVLIEGDSLKIIDYAESAMVDQNFVPKHSLGYTLPYSPFECSHGREEGFNKKEIDLWSVSLILYEMAFKSIPMFYTRWIGSDIVEKWSSTTDFFISPIYRKRKGLRGIEEAISVISMRGIQVKQADRLSLKTYHKLLSHLKQYHGFFKSS